MRIRSCGLVVVLVCAAIAGCAATPTDADEDQVTQGITNTAAFTLTVSGNFFADTSVTTTNVNDLCPAGSQCQFGFIGGSTLTIRPTATQDLIDCLKFSGWQGACAGQGSTCTVVINSDISVSQSRWTKISGCVPK